MLRRILILKGGLLGSTVGCCGGALATSGVCTNKPWMIIIGITLMVLAISFGVWTDAEQIKEFEAACRHD